MPKQKGIRNASPTIKDSQLEREFYCRPILRTIYSVHMAHGFAKDIRWMLRLMLLACTASIMYRQIELTTNIQNSRGTLIFLRAANRSRETETLFGK